MKNILSTPLIHYGSTTYNRRQLKPIKNSWIKPDGGLWTSPVNSNWGWKDWCKAEDFADCNEANSFTLLLKETAKVFVIDTLKDLTQAPLVQSIGMKNFKYINFELLASQYDAIYLTVNGERATRWSQPVSLYGWDCESVLIMNPYCCKQIKAAIYYVK